jgi:hypothetical protein
LKVTTSTVTVEQKMRVTKVVRKYPPFLGDTKESMVKVSKTLPIYPTLHHALTMQNKIIITIIIIII